MPDFLCMSGWDVRITSIVDSDWWLTLVFSVISCPPKQWHVDFLKLPFRTCPPFYQSKPRWTMVVDIYNTRGNMLNQYWCQPIRLLPRQTSSPRVFWQWNFPWHIHKHLPQGCAFYLAYYIIFMDSLYIYIKGNKIFYFQLTSEVWFGKH